MMRVFLFLFTNLAVVTLFSIITSFIGVDFSSVFSLMIISLIIGFSGSIFSLFMSKAIALSSVGGVVIHNPLNELEIWLLGVVNKQSRKIGIIAPQVAIYQSSDMNAFATGSRRDSALIAISSGLLHGMHRDEVEAVIAHEITHISNGDMVTMTLIQGIINTFVIFISRFLAQIVSSFLYSYRDEEDSNSNKFVYFISTMILELFFGILASIIVFWFSRYREFYADAGSAKLVGCEKMISALQRLKVGKILHECAVEHKHFVSLFINGNSYYLTNKVTSFSELFMSHPPLDKRIEALRSGAYFKKKSIFHSS